MTQRLYAVPTADDRVFVSPVELLRHELDAVEGVLIESSRSEVKTSGVCTPADTWRARSTLIVSGSKT